MSDILKRLEDAAAYKGSSPFAAAIYRKAAAEIKWLQELVKTSYYEGYKAGHIEKGRFRDSRWHMSTARRALMEADDE